MLIDECDSALISTLYKVELHKKNQSILKPIFILLKDLDEYLEFGMLISCSDKEDYMPGGIVDGVQAYFPSTESTSYQLLANFNTFAIAVYRVNDSETVSVPVTVTASSTNTATDAFTFPGSVSFNAGEKMKIETLVN